MHRPSAMTARDHHALRAFGLLLLAIAALWPRSHAARHDADVARRAIRGQYATAAARPSVEDPPRPRSERLFSSTAETEADESQLRD